MEQGGCQKFQWTPSRLLHRGNSTPRLHKIRSRLLEKSRQHLVKLADENGIELRQNYNREAPRLAAQVGRYAHAKQYRRMKKTIKALRTRVGRVHREINRKLGQLPEQQQTQA